MAKMIAALFCALPVLLIIGSPQAAALQLSSTAFIDGGAIASKYARPAAGGHNVSIPLKWTGAPEGTQLFALTIVDQHPIAHKWVHWMVINIPPDVTSLPEDASGKSMPPAALEMRNSFGDIGYGGPQPPRGTGPHRYVVTVYALKAPRLDLKPDTTLSGFHDAIRGNVLEEASITGLFEQ